MLRIGFAGTLGSYDPHSRSKSCWGLRIREWLWTYTIKDEYFYPRCGYHLFRGLAEFRKRYPRLSSEIRADLWGLINSANQRQADEMGLTNMVRIGGYVERNESRERLEGCDILFLPVEAPLNGYPQLTIPGKLFEYLQLGKPILALSEPSDVTEILEDSGLGIVCSPSNPGEIAETLRYLVEVQDHLGDIYTPDKVYIQSFDFAVLAQKLARVFDEVLK